MRENKARYQPLRKLRQQQFFADIFIRNLSVGHLSKIVKGATLTNHCFLDIFKEWQFYLKGFPELFLNIY